MVKSLIGGNLIHLAELETRSPGRQCSRQCFCHLLFVSVKVIHVPRGWLSVARLHEHIPSDPGHYRPIQQHGSLLTWASLSGLTSWALAWAWLNTPTNPHLKDYQHKLRLKSGDGVTASHMSITWSAHGLVSSLQHQQADHKKRWNYISHIS